MYYDQDERRKVLDKYNDALKALVDWDYKQQDKDDVSDHDMLRYDQMANMLTAAAQEYTRKTPVIPVSRCPISKQVAYHSIDYYGIDGPWWDYTKPLRPVESLPVTFFTSTGAMKLNGPVTYTNHQVRPGPEAPYVVRHLIESDEIKAVISSIKVGQNQAYMVFYYSGSDTPSAEPTRLWGMYRWERADKYGRVGHLEIDDRDYVYDFDLMRWVRMGKLLWIAPNDPTMTLREGVQGCPYLNIEGSKKFQIIIDGEVSYPEEEEE